MATTLPGVRHQDEQDFPNTTREALTTLPYHAGGTITLAANTITDLVKPSDLRRFETLEKVVFGTHTGANNATILTDANGDFEDWGIQVGDLIRNVTANTSSIISDLTSTTISTEDDITWAVNSQYEIDKNVSHQGARCVEIRKFSLVVDKNIRVGVDRHPDSTSSTGYIEVTPNESYFVENIRIVSRIAVVGSVTSETPEVRWSAWGI